jgi:dihydropteroate synthase
MFAPRRSYTIPLPGGRTLSLGERCLVMGILNVTPDSFADASPRLDPAIAVDAAQRMEAEGADLVDIGGESTRPGASAVSAGEELDRVMPVIRALSTRLRIPMSVDTYKASVARAAVDAGAAIVNDVSGFRFEPALAGTVAESGAALVLMHSRGRSSTMYDEAVYDDVVREVIGELGACVRFAVDNGIAAERIVLDPGVGFAKRASHSYGVLARLPDLAAALDRPILVGPSRKSFLREAVGDRPAADRDWGTAAATAAAVLAGAHVVRVHAVGEMAQVVRVADEIRRHQPLR